VESKKVELTETKSRSVVTWGGGEGRKRKRLVNICQEIKGKNCDDI